MYVVIVNPLSGQGKALALAKQVMERIEQTGHKGRLLHCCALNSLNRQLQHAADAGADSLVIIGGDGTVHQVINRLPHLNFDIGFLPAGTGNDLARALDLGSTRSEQIDVALFQPTKPVSVGRCNGNYFLTSVGIGFEGLIAHSVARRRHAFCRSSAGYKRAILGNIFSYSANQAEFTNCRWRGDEAFLLCTVANSPYSGGGYKVAPNASLQRSELSLVRIAPMAAFARIAMLLKVTKGEHISVPGVEQIDINHLEIRTDSPLAAHIDGEPFFANRFRFSSCEEKIQLRCLGLR